jgi:hypothetical protein
MSITIDEATALGFAVHGYLNMPELGSELAAAVPAEARIAALMRTVEHLQAIGLVSEAQRNAIHGLLFDGVAPAAAEASDPRTVGSVLITTAQRYPYQASTVPDVYAALAAVADAAVEGQAHGGPWAALCCAAVAAVDVLTEAHKEMLPFAHKEHAPFAHKEHAPAAHKETLPFAHKE